MDLVRRSNEVLCSLRAERRMVSGEKAGRSVSASGPDAQGACGTLAEPPVLCQSNLVLVFVGFPSFLSLFYFLYHTWNTSLGGLHCQGSRERP